MPKLNWKTIIQGVLITLLGVFVIFIFTASARLRNEVSANTIHRTKDAVEIKSHLNQLERKYHLSDSITDAKLDTIMLRQAVHNARIEQYFQKSN